MPTLPTEYLETMDVVLTALIEERDRLNRDRLVMLAAGAAQSGSPLILVESLLTGEITGFDPLDFQARIDGCMTMIEAIEGYVSTTVKNCERKFVEGKADESILRRCLQAGANIVEAVGGVSPIGDFGDDVVKFVKDTARQAAALVPAAGFGAGAVLLVGGALLLSR